MSSSWTFLPVFAGRDSCAKNILRNLSVLSGFFCLIVTLSACGDSSSPKYSSSPTAPPPGTSERPLEPGQLGRTLGPDGLPVLDQPKGVNVSPSTLFAEDIRDPIERIKRVENAILEMRRDYDATLPAIKRLVGIEKDMQTLMAQLEMLTGTAPDAVPVTPVSEESLSAAPAMQETPQQNDPLPLVPAVPEARSTQVSPGAIAPLATSDLSEAPASAPAAAPETPKVDATTTVKAPPTPPSTPPPEKPPEKPMAASPPEPSASGVSGVRLGEDGGKTRLVIDIGNSVSHRTDLDNDEKIMVIEINNATWNTTASKTFTSPLIKSYTTQPLESGKGTRLILTLKKPVKIVLDTLLNPEGNNKNYRLVIDLKGQ